MCVYGIRSLEVLRVAFDLPVDQSCQVVEHHVLVRLNLLVGKDNAEVNAGIVHAVLVLDWLSEALQVKVML